MSEQNVVKDALQVAIKDAHQELVGFFNEVTSNPKWTAFAMHALHTYCTVVAEATDGELAEMLPVAVFEGRYDSWRATSKEIAERIDTLGKAHTHRMVQSMMNEFLKSMPSDGPVQ